MDYSKHKVPVKTRYILAFIFCTLRPTILTHAKISEERARELQSMLGLTNLYKNQSEQHPYSDWVLQLTDEEIAWLIPIIQKIRDKIDDPDSLLLRDQWNGLLAYLGDDEAMKMNIESWRNHITSLEVSRAKSGQLPLYLEPEVFKDEVFDPNLRHYPNSFNISWYILDYLHYNKHYPQDVRDWAGRMYKNKDQMLNDPTDIRKIYRKWYRTNEAFIRTEQYDKVKPGEELPPRPGVLEANGLGDNPPPSAIKRSRGGESIPVPTPASGSAIPEPERRPADNFTVFAAISAILAAILIFFRRRLFPKK